MTATDLFVASLAADVAFYLRRYLARYDQPSDGLRVTADYIISSAWPIRVTSVELTISLPSGLPVGWVQALHAIATRCPIYQSMSRPPRIAVRVVCGTPHNGTDDAIRHDASSRRAAISA